MSKLSKNPYRSTLIAAFTDYFVQAIVSVFAPLLFVTFQTHYGLSLKQLSFLVTMTFGVQLLSDLTIPYLVRLIGVRTAIVISNACSALGLLLLPILANNMQHCYAGILTAAFFYSLGSALTEVLLSPIVEACPVEDHAGTMSLLHSFYSWGSAAVVLISTVYFLLFGTEHWGYLSAAFALVPITDGIIFLKVPLATLPGDEAGKGMKVRELIKDRAFFPIMLLMLAAGGADLAVSQWASALAEEGLGVSKAVGDLLGPLLFALNMGLSRVFFAKNGQKHDAENSLLVSAAVCMAGFLCTVFAPWPFVSLLGCGVCGLGVGILWPGTLSIGSRRMPFGGTLLFSFMAFFGDIGCALGPALVGFVADAAGGDLKIGLLAGSVCPALAIISLLLLRRSKPKEG